MSFVFKIATLLGLLAVADLSTPVAAQKAPVVAAASDLQFAVKDIAAQFKADTNREVRLSVGSSGNFLGSFSKAHPSNSLCRLTRLTFFNWPMPD